MEEIRKSARYFWLFFILIWGAILPAYGRKQPVAASQQPSVELASIQGKSLLVSVTRDGFYSISDRGTADATLRSQVAVALGTHLLQSSMYPKHSVDKTTFQDTFGAGQVLTVTYSGLSNQPDILCVFHLYTDQPWGEMQVYLHNTTDKVVAVHAIYSVRATGEKVVDLHGPDAADRVLSDSYSEDRPTLKIMDLGEPANGIHRAVGSQLIYNRQSGQSFFLGALTSDRLLTIFHLRTQHASGSPSILSYDVDATGTTEIVKEDALKDAPAKDQIELSLPVNPGASLSSEKLMFAVGSDYHAQLETYGNAIRILHHARVSTPTPIGWWSWTAYYFGLAQGTAITNASWLSQHLKDLGYVYFHIDEGYQYARGEYATPNATLFPRGMGYIGSQVRKDGLTFGIWTAPFEVADRSWVFQNHKDWLVHNGTGAPIPIGDVSNGKDSLYVLDATNPGAQDYLRKTYRTLVQDWGVRFIKMDFMDSSAIEGYYYRPHTTALEAQRIGLQIIRDTVGNDVVLDKDGSPMLNPVGIVDTGRVSADTSHAFSSSRSSASGIAARYYMNRNFFISDPDAFTVSRQTIPWPGERSKPPLTLSEAKVSIALAAISGGMFEIGDDLPTLGLDADRVALVRNQELLNMARLGRASRPVDLMTYSAEDEMPSIFLLREDKHQSILTVFNWTEGARSHTFQLADLGFPSGGSYHAYDVFENQNPVPLSANTLVIQGQAPHSVRMIKIVNDQIPAAAPTISGKVPTAAEWGENLTMSAQVDSTGVPAVQYRWDFGDGTHAAGATVQHAYTVSKDQTVKLTVDGVDGIPAVTTFSVHVTGQQSPSFAPEQNRRWSPQP